MRREIVSPSQDCTRNVYSWGAPLDLWREARDAAKKTIKASRGLRAGVTGLHSLSFSFSLLPRPSPSWVTQSNGEERVSLSLFFVQGLLASPKSTSIKSINYSLSCIFFFSWLSWYRNRSCSSKGPPSPPPQKKPHTLKRKGGKESLTKQWGRERD